MHGSCDWMVSDDVAVQDSAKRDCWQAQPSPFHDMTRISETLLVDLINGSRSNLRLCNNFLDVTLNSVQQTFESLEGQLPSRSRHVSSGVTTHNVTHS